MLLQLPEDHKLKSDLHSTLPLYVLAFATSLIQNHYWIVALSLLVVEVVVVRCVFSATRKVTSLDVQVE